MMLAGIDALFGGSGKDDAPLPAAVGASAAAPNGGSALGELAAGGDEAALARAEYIKRFQLDRLFASAVDRAMRHNVSSPVEFIAHELLRTVEQQSQQQAAA